MNKPTKRSPTAPEARSWTKVIIEGNRGDCEEVAAFLADLTGDGVECVPVAGDRGSPRERVVGYLGDDALYPQQKKKLENFLTQFRERSSGSPPELVLSEPMPQEDWLKAWKAHFKASRVTPRLAVKPPWADYSVKEGEHVIEIEPGMAFGTGLHASTRLVLAFLDELYQLEEKGPRFILDIGTGTGILAIAGALLGAESVTAIDNDKDALPAARGNVRRNRLEKKVEVSGRDLAAVSGAYDLVIANIYHDALAELSELIVRRIHVPGIFICSGILAVEQPESLRGLYERRGLKFLASKSDGDWAALKFSL